MVLLRTLTFVERLQMNRPSMDRALTVELVVVARRDVLISFSNSC